METSACFKVGYILKAHGLRGEVTIARDPGGPDFDTIESVFIEKNDRLIPYFIESVSTSGSKAFVKFEDVDSHESAAAISKCAVYLPKTMRAKSGKDNFYEDEVIGFEVDDSTAGLLGSVTGVTAAGPNKLLAVDHKGKEILIPVNGPFITGINKTKKKISVELPEGFLDI